LNPRTQTTTHTNANRQHYHTWSGKQQRYEKIKVDGHELASMHGGKIKQR
jgi:hypothetical protein